MQIHSLAHYLLAYEAENANYTAFFFVAYSLTESELADGALRMSIGFVSHSFSFLTFYLHWKKNELHGVCETNCALDNRMTGVKRIETDKSLKIVPTRSLSSSARQIRDFLSLCDPIPTQPIVRVMFVLIIILAIVGPAVTLPLDLTCDTFENCYACLKAPKCYYFESVVTQERTCTEKSKMDFWTRIKTQSNCDILEKGEQLIIIF
jgi:hypothetical protein